LLFIAFRLVQTIASMIILRTKMNPLVAIWYRFVNDPLQIYLTAVCFWMILSGRMPTTRKIWLQVPRSGVTADNTGSFRKIAVQPGQPSNGAALPQTALPQAAPALPQAAPAPEPAAVVTGESPRDRSG
jgi:hypothetical protein